MRRTLAQETQRADAAVREADVLLCALNDILRQEIKWFRAAPYRLGISRPDGPQGGIVVVGYYPKDQRASYSAHYWEDWWPRMRDVPPHANNTEGVALYGLGLRASEYIARCQRGDAP